MHTVCKHVGLATALVLSFGSHSFSGYRPYPETCLPSQTNPFMPSLCNRENREPLGTKPAYRACHDAAKEPTLEHQHGVKLVTAHQLARRSPLTFQNPSLSKPQRFDHPRSKHHQDPNCDDRAHNGMVFHKSFNAIDLVADFLVSLSECDAHRPSRLDGFL